MENENPIFVTGFSRGGTTILMNLLASHPEVCTVGEIHQVFKGSNVLDSAWQILTKAITRDLPLMLASGQDWISPRNWAPRTPISARTQRFIRRVLRRAKINSDHEYLNCYKAPEIRYTDGERNAARLLGKNLDGLALLSDTMVQMYPEAEVVGLIRNGFAVCEGHVQRGRSAADVGRLYRTVVEKMLSDQKRAPNYHIVKFDELVRNPIAHLKALCVRLGLNPFRLRHVRVQQRKFINASGERELVGDKEWALRWMELDELSEFLDPQVDARQIGKLSHGDREAFLSEAGDVMERLGYLDSHCVRMAQAA